MSATKGRQSSPTPAVVPMKPQRRALAVLSIALALWIGVLIVLYITTVRPHRLATPEATPVLSH